MKTFARRSWRRPWRPPAWRVAAAMLAAFFVVAGSSKLIDLGRGTAGVFGPLTSWIGTAEVVGGLMLLAPGLISHAAVLLSPVVCLIAFLGAGSAGWAMTIPAAAVLAAVVSLGYARKPGALLRSRLQRALDRVVRLEEMARKEEGYRESVQGEGCAGLCGAHGSRGRGDRLRILQGWRGIDARADHRGRARRAHAVAVTIDEVTVRGVQRKVDVVGSLFGLEEASVSSRASGTVIRIRRDIGDVVRPGDVLLEIDPNDAELAIAEARRSLDVELAKLGMTGSPGESLDQDALPSVLVAASKEKLARINLERIQRLGSRNASTSEELETTRAGFAQAEASHRQALLDDNTTLAAVQLRGATLDSALQKLKDCRVVVPTPSEKSGTPSTGVEYLVAERSISEGETARPASTLCRLVIAEALKLRAFVPERHLAEVRVGQPVEVEDDVYPGEKFSARVNPTIDRSSRTFQVEILVRNAGRRLSAGCFASAAIQTRLDPEARTIPDESVVQFAGSAKVFVIRDGKAAEAPVTLTGLRFECGSQGSPRYRVEVAGSLRLGEPVVTSGQSKLTDGVAVKIRQEEGETR